VAILTPIDLDMGVNPDFDVMCSSCEVIFHLIWEQQSGAAILSYCPFCGEELEDETDN